MPEICEVAETEEQFIGVVDVRLLEFEVVVEFRDGLFFELFIGHVLEDVTDRLAVGQA